MYCKYCKENVVTWERHVLTDEHKDKAQINHSDDVCALDIAFKARIIAYRIYNKDHQNLNYTVFFNSDHVSSNLKSLLTSYLHLHSALKFQLILYGQYVKHNEAPEEGEDEIIEMKKNFQTSMIELLQADNIETVLTPLFDQLIGQSEELIAKGSGWALTKILYIELHLNKYSPLSGGSYIKLPKHLESKHACYNPRNNDNQCFKWAVRGYLRHSELMIQYSPGIRSNPGIQKFIYREVTEMKQDTASRIDQQYSLNWSGIDTPIKIKQINDFLIWNPSFSITLYGIDAEDSRTIVGPLFRSEEIQERHIHLLLLEEKGTNHICIIKDLTKLVASQLGGRQIHREVCDNCLRTFNHYEQLVEHQKEDCIGIVTYLPPSGTKMKFKNHANSIKAPITCYADFESVLVPVQGCENLPESSNTTRKRQHVASSYSFLIKYDTDPSKDYLETYRGEDCTEKFVNNLYGKLKSLYEELVLNNYHPMEYTAADKVLFERQKHCHICKRFIVGKKVRDHDHQTGKFRGAACDECNKKYYLTKEVSVFFHNLSKYDAHLFIEDLAKLESDRNIQIIPSTDETYISFMKPIEIIKNRNTDDDETNHDRIYLKVRFKDSYRFFPGSLASQALNLTSTQYKNTEKFLLEEYSPEVVEMVKRKGIFPYEYIDSFDRYNEDRLPSKDKFCDISDENYQYALDVYNKADCKNIGDYNDLYLKTDVLILADIFENFRSICIKPESYGLDPVHYYTLPGFSWDAMLKYTGEELELLSDLKMINFFNKGIRGGLSQCSFRYAKANNKYLTTHDRDGEQSYLQYLDVNNLYGWAMTHPLPINDFIWLTSEEIVELQPRIFDIEDDDEDGYILEVDLHYPEYLHEYHDDLPFCPEKRKFGSTYKLCATLEDKTKYIIHYRNLKQAMENGLELKKIHRVLKFYQKAWLAPYINFNNGLRTKATTNAEKDLFKLMNNSIFGKAIENVRKRRNIYLCDKWESVGQKKGAEGYVASGYVFLKTLIGSINTYNLFYILQIHETRQSLQ